MTIKCSIKQKYYLNIKRNSFINLLYSGKNNAKELKELTIAMPHPPSKTLSSHNYGLPILPQYVQKNHENIYHLILKLIPNPRNDLEH